MALYGETVVTQNGEAPWTAEDYLGQLTQAFVAAEGHEGFRYWYPVLEKAGQLAHYIEDLHNPMHLTAEYDGPYVGYGLHWRYEGLLVDRHLDGDDLAIARNTAACAVLPSFIDTVFDSIDVNYYWNDDIQQADADGVAASGGEFDEVYYSELWAGTGDFTQDLFQDGSEMVAAAWYTAWVDAGRPVLPVVPEPATITLLAIGAAAVLRRRR